MDLAEPRPILLTPTQAAALLGIGRTKVYELITSGRLFSLRIDSSRRVPRASVDAFVAALVDEADVAHSKRGASPGGTARS